MFSFLNTFFFIKEAIQRKRQRFWGGNLRKVGGILQIDQKQNDVLFFCCSNLNGIVCEVFNVSVHFSGRERRRKERRVGKNQIHVS